MGVGGQCHTLATFFPGNRPSTHCTTGWVGPRTGLDGGNKSWPPPGFDPRTVQPVACHYTELPAANNFWKYDSVNPNTNIQCPESNYKKQNGVKTSFIVPKHHPHQQCTAVSDALLLAAMCYWPAVQNSWSCPTVFPEWSYWWKAKIK